MSLLTNALYYGDCLDWMSQWDDGCVDLIYLDPPFNSNANYNILYTANGGSQAQFRAFDDTWRWDEAAADRFARFENAVGRPAHHAIVGLHRILGPSGMLAYLTYMAERLEQMHRILKDTGSLYLHCDPTMAHYLKVILDVTFGYSNFRNEVVWCYHAGGASKRRFARKHHTIFVYGKNTKKSKHNVLRVLPYRDIYARDKHGNPNPGYHPDGKMLHDWWEIPQISSVAKERLGYPTQKPIALLNRIIEASSDPGDIVLDPFCGCGTAVDASRRLKRQFVGIDISSFAIDLIIDRRLKDHSIPTYGIPTDMASARKLAREKPFDFESWAITRLPGFAPNTRQRSDGGVDGRATLVDMPSNFDSKLALAQVKGSESFSLSSLRDFIWVAERDRAALGCYVTLEPVTSSHARMEVANTGTITVTGNKYRRVQLWPVTEYFEDRLPKLPVMADPFTGKPMAQGRLF